MSRSNALANEASHKFIDSISLDLMKDPVIAADGHSYDRRTITNWFETQKAQGRPITSPQTNLPLNDDTLTPNTTLKKELDLFIASTSTIQPDDVQFTLSSEIFKELDRLSSMPEMRLLDFEPPKIVVLGNESHGKSTILERVIGLPLFPKEKGMCTRCVVRVHMRRCVADQPSIAEISVKKTTNVTASRNTQPPPLPTEAAQIVALDNIRETIREFMDDLVRRDPQRRMIIDDHEIIVKINLPYCLNVDILDLPGLVTTSPASTSQNLPQVTKEIAMRVIREQRESSFFLLVNDVRVPANQSRGCEVVQEAKIEDRTLGIFTKVDTFVSEDGSESAELQQLLDSSRGGFPLGYGWMAAASRSADMNGTTNKLQAFQTMEQNESRCFREKYGDLAAMNKMGIQQIRQRIQTLYESFIRDRWIPHIPRTQNQFNQSPDSIFSTIWSKFSREEDSNFKLERFDDLVSALVKALANSLDKIVQSFDQWFAEFMSRINETPLLKPVHYSLPGEVRCTLYWYSRDDMHSFPDVILENFYRCVKENWPKRHALVVYLHDLPGLKENCKATRLNYFKEAKKVNEVKEAVEAFARKVQKEILKEEGKGKEGGGEL